MGFQIGTLTALLILGLSNALPYRRAFNPKTWKPPSGPQCVYQSPLDSTARAAKATTLKPLPTPAECGKSKYHKTRDLDELKRIIGGEKSKEGSFPWLVGLGQGDPRDRKWKPGCGAAIIDKQWVLTAAHCFLIENPPGSQRYLPANKMYVNPCEWVIHSGENKVLNPSQDLQVIGLKEVILHPKFSSTTIQNDIALLKLDKELDLSHQDANTLCLPTKNQKYDRSSCTIAGWGDTKDKAGLYSDVILHVNLPHLSQEQCQKAHFAVESGLSEGMICAGHMEGGKDSCQGDSGGPLFCKRSDQRWTHIGIASWGMGCARKGVPGVYADVIHYLPWIQDILTRYSGSTNIVPWKGPTVEIAGDAGGTDGTGGTGVPDGTDGNGGPDGTGETGVPDGTDGNGGPDGTDGTRGTDGTDGTGSGTGGTDGTDGTGSGTDGTDNTGGPSGTGDDGYYY